MTVCSMCSAVYDSIAEHGGRERAASVSRSSSSARVARLGSPVRQPAYAAGVDWLTLLAWRFLFAACAVVGMAADLARPTPRITQPAAAAVLVLIALGFFFLGNSGLISPGSRRCSASLVGADRVHVPGHRGRAHAPFGRRLEGRRAWGALGLATFGVVLAVGGIDPSQPVQPIGPC